MESLGGVSGLSSALKFGGFLTNPDASGMRGLRPVNAMLRFPSAPWLRPLLPPRGSWRRQAENRPRHAGRKLGVPVGALALPRKGTRRTLTGFPSHSRVACWGPQQPFACRGKIERTRHSSSFVLHERAISRPQRSRCDARHNFDERRIMFGLVALSSAEAQRTGARN